MKLFATGWCLVLVLAAGVAVAAGEDCISCHERLSPAAVNHWRQSAHADRVGCADCHGTDHQRLEQGGGSVSAEVCGGCHQQAYLQHRESRHGMGLHSGWGCTRNLSGRDRAECRFCHQEGSTLPVTRVQCARFLAQSSEMGALGCNRCHEVETSCASCHSNHQTSARIARDPRVCAKCHMGPDHPQWEIWETSQHGQLYQVGGSDSGPGCQDCHMPDKSHNVSRGISVTPAGKPLPGEQAEPARTWMLQVCSNCHAPGFARRELESGDRIREQSLEQVNAARKTIEELADLSLLQPMPDDRPAHPLQGQQLVLDSQMLYEDTSHIERLFFKMQKYDYAKTWKGAYHQNPAYTHWYGNAELKMDLVDIRSEALRLRQPATSRINEDPLAATEMELKRLQGLYRRQAIDAEEYVRQKRQLLERLEASHAGQE